MNIIGPDELVFGVDDLSACAQYLTDYGLRSLGDGRFEALDGTGVRIAHRDDPALPQPLGSGAMLRKTTYGVADQATIEAIAAELSKDREVKRLKDGSLESVDDLGFVLGFQITSRRPLSLPGEEINAPGANAKRPPNHLGVTVNAAPKPRTLSHVVYFVPDSAKGEAFYVNRLGFICTDRFTDVGPFLRPAGTLEHHTLFLIQTPAFMQGCEHFTFHMGGPSEVLQAGARFVEKGYQSFWGPGRHIFGSNWFWYFNSPLGCHVEYDADMDLHDDAWVARELEANADTSQVFLFARREKWYPSAAPVAAADEPDPRRATA